MSLSLLRRRAPLTPGKVVIPATPTAVVVEMLARFAVGHDLNPAAPRTACDLALWPFWTLTLPDAQRLEVHWCDWCWPGYRCVICGVPSGDSDECARCVHDSLDHDQRIDEAA